MGKNYVTANGLRPDRANSVHVPPEPPSQLDNVVCLLVPSESQMELGTNQRSLGGGLAYSHVAIFKAKREIGDVLVVFHSEQSHPGVRPNVVLCRKD